MLTRFSSTSKIGNMSRLTLTIFVILSLIICPIRCVNGVSCCAANSLETASQPVTETTCCEQCQRSKDAPIAPPCEHKYACQCVCGGLIFGDPIVISDVSPELIDYLTTDSLTPESHASADLAWGERGSTADLCSGRGLRTLFCSYLC